MAETRRCNMHANMANRQDPRVGVLWNNRVDPRVGRDWNHRTQNVAGTNMAGNVQPRNTRYASNRRGSNKGPYSSVLYNKFDSFVNRKQKT